jgi:hypothetical protein
MSNEHQTDPIRVIVSELDVGSAAEKRKTFDLKIAKL